MTTKLTEMWVALKAYQPQADTALHGDSWAVMCRDRTYVAARSAAREADACNDQACRAAYSAAFAATYAAAFSEAYAAYGIYAEQAIDQITSITTPQAQPTPVQDESLAKAWGEGYQQGVEDERTSEANIGIAGFGAKVRPARNNPYGTTPQVQPAPEWQPIKTAPHKKPIIGSRGAWVGEVMFSGNGYWITPSGDEISGLLAWQNFPPPPKEQS